MKISLENNDSPNATLTYNTICGHFQVAAQAVLDTRDQFKGQTLADLYDPNTMPPDLTDAHAKLDRAVDKSYRKESFKTERERVEYLFQLYEALQSPLVLTKRQRMTSSE